MGAATSRPLFEPYRRSQYSVRYTQYLADYTYLWPHQLRRNCSVSLCLVLFSLPHFSFVGHVHYGCNDVPPAWYWLTFTSWLSGLISLTNAYLVYSCAQQQSVSRLRPPLLTFVQVAPCSLCNSYNSSLATETEWID